MGSFGENLRREREMRGITLAEIAQATKISARMLSAIESGREDQLPGGIFNRSFVRQYARYLGLDEERVVTEFEMAQDQSPEGSRKPDVLSAEALAAVREPDSTSGATESAPGRARLIFAAALGIAALGVAGWKTWTILAPIEKTWPGGATSRLQRIEQIPSPRSGAAAPSSVTSVSPQAPAATSSPEAANSPDLTPASAAEPGTALAAKNAQPPVTVGPSNASPSAASLGATQSPSATSTVSTSQSSPLHLQVSAVDASWVAVYRDGQKVWEAELQPGESRTITGTHSVAVRAGNAAGVVLTLNGETLPPLGRKGEVKTVTYTAPRELGKAGPHPTEPRAGAAGTPGAETGAPKKKNPSYEPRP